MIQSGQSLMMKAGMLARWAAAAIVTIASCKDWRATSGAQRRLPHIHRLSASTLHNFAWVPGYTHPSSPILPMSVGLHMRPSALQPRSSPQIDPWLGQRLVSFSRCFLGNPLIRPLVLLRVVSSFPGVIQKGALSAFARTAICSRSVHSSATSLFGSKLRTTSSPRSFSCTT